MHKTPSSCTEKEWLDLLLDKYAVDEIKAMRRFWMDFAMDSESHLPTPAHGMHPFWTRLCLGEPIQYVLGKSYFLGKALGVGPGVLIPRPETEELVEWVLADPLIKDVPANQLDTNVTNFLDLGTGSGCIALALVHFRAMSEVIALDCEEKALQIALCNANAWGVASRIQFYQADFMLPGWRAPAAKFWVSNPPYIGADEAITMEAHVLDYEPSVALFAPGSNPMGVYRALISSFLTSPCSECFWMELNPRYALQVVGLVDKAYEIRMVKPLADLESNISEVVDQEMCGEFEQLEWTLRRDMQGYWRMLRIRKKSSALYENRLPIDFS
jgi:release factor glutamine methyltransferase